MEKGEFRMIRNAVKEYAEHTATSYHDVLHFFKNLKKFDPKILSDGIQGLSGIREIKDFIGQEKYELFISVAMEKERELQTADARLETILAMPQGTEQSTEMLKFAQWSMDAAEKEIKDDPRIRKAFSKQEAELDKLITTTKTWVQSALASAVLHSTSGSDETQ